MEKEFKTISEYFNSLKRSGETVYADTKENDDLYVEIRKNAEKRAKKEKEERK